MAFSNPATSNLESIQGIILSTSTALYNSYTYSSLPRDFPTVDSSDSFGAIIADSLITAPHFPDINILDSISDNILYQTYNYFQTDFFHIYNLINRNHFTVSFPYSYPYVNTAIAIHECNFFKVVIVCIVEHSNPLLGYGGDGTKPLIFYVYSFKSITWSHNRSPSSAFTSDQLLPSRRKPVHAGEDVVYLDLIDHFLICFASMKEKLDPIPKMVLSWERDSIKLDEMTRYGGCRGSLHCAKFNPIKMQVEVCVDNRAVERSVGVSGGWKRRKFELEGDTGAPP